MEFKKQLGDDYARLRIRMLCGRRRPWCSAMHVWVCDDDDDDDDDYARCADLQHRGAQRVRKGKDADAARVARTHAHTHAQQVQQLALLRKGEQLLVR